MDTIEACRGVDELLGIHMCKNLFLCNAQKTTFYLLLMPGEKKFQTREVSKQIGSSRLSFAPEEFLEEYLHISEIRMCFNSDSRLNLESEFY